MALAFTKPLGHADRVFCILREHNPELTGEKRRTIVKPPQVAREGTKKTVFTNYMELCKAMNRSAVAVTAMFTVHTLAGAAAGLLSWI